MKSEEPKKGGLKKKKLEKGKGSQGGHLGNLQKRGKKYVGENSKFDREKRPGKGRKRSGFQVTARGSWKGR